MRTSPLVNVIHNTAQNERYKTLIDEFITQGITKYKIWPALHEKTVIKSINLAHKQIIKWAKENSLPTVTIFEDDIKFTGNGAFDYFIQNEPPEYDLYLGGFFLGEIKDGLLKEFTALHCYTVHQRFYDTFLNTKDDIHLDQALSGLGMFVPCDPMVAIQHNGWSSNSRQHCNFDPIFKNRKLYTNG